MRNYCNRHDGSYRHLAILLCAKFWFFDSNSVNHTLHRNTYLSTLRFWGVFCLTANIRTSQRTVSAMQWFAVSQKNRTEAITISPFSLSLLFSAKNRWFSTLRCTKTGSTQPKLSAACFVVQSCLADADFVVFSDYCLIGTRHKATFDSLNSTSIFSPFFINSLISSIVILKWTPKVGQT